MSHNTLFGQLVGVPPGFKSKTAIEQIYISLLKHGDEAEMRDSREPDTVRIHFVDPEYGMDGFTLTLVPFDEP